MNKLRWSRIRARFLPMVPGAVVAAVVTLVPAAAWPQGNPVGPEFRVNNFTTNSQWTPAIAADAQGNFVVVWDSVAQDYAATSGIFGQRYDSSGAPRGGEFRVNTYVTGSQFFPAVASHPSGNFVVVWQGNVQDGSADGVFGQRFASNGAPAGPEFRVNTHTGNLQGLPSVAVDPAGNFVVAWTSQFQDGSYLGVFAQRYASTGAPVGPEFRVNSIVALDQSSPSVGIDPAGNFVIAWTSEVGDGSSYGIFGQRFTAFGVPLGAEFRINTHTTDAQGSPAVDVDGAGKFVVVWSSQLQDGAGLGIFGQRFAASGAPVGGEFRANTHAPLHQWFPAVAIDDSGNFVVAWQSQLQDGSSDGIYGQRYDAAGTPLGAEFRVNTSVYSSQERPAVAADDAGEFVVVWANWAVGNSAEVAGQRYNLIVPVELTHFSIE